MLLFIEGHGGSSARSSDWGLTRWRNNGRGCGHGPPRLVSYQSACQVRRSGRCDEDRSWGPALGCRDSPLAHWRAFAPSSAKVSARLWCSAVGVKPRPTGRIGTFYRRRVIAAADSMLMAGRRSVFVLFLAFCLAWLLLCLLHGDDPFFLFQLGQNRIGVICSGKWHSENQDRWWIYLLGSAHAQPTA